MSPKEVFIMSRKRRSFTDEYKAEVVNLITEPLSANMTEALTPLGITVGRWRFNRWQQREKR